MRHQSHQSAIDGAPTRNHGVGLIDACRYQPINDQRDHAEIESASTSRICKRSRPLHIMAASVLLQAALLLNFQDAAIVMAASAPSRKTTANAAAAFFGPPVSYRSSENLKQNGPMTTLSSRRTRYACPTQRHQQPLHVKISEGLSTEEVSTDIEYASHDDTDKVLQMEALLGGSINVTSIEEIDDGFTTISMGNGKKEDKRQQDEEQEHQEKQPTILPIGKLWKRRHARSAEEGIRSEKETGKELSTLLESASSVTTDGKSAKKKKTGMARTIAGLIVALAEEAEDLEVEVDARRDTPLSGRHVDAIRINFSKLGFAPLRMGGLNEAIRDFEADLNAEQKDDIAHSISSEPVYCVDEAFDRIDADNSGALDEEELATALSQAARIQGRRAKEVMSGLASRLVRLYDTDGDGFVDREEYQNMVQDMSALREAKQQSLEDMGKEEERNRPKKKSWWRPRQLAGRVLGRQSADSDEASTNDAILVTNSTTQGIVTPQDKANGKRLTASDEAEVDFSSAVDVSGDSAFLPSSSKEGSIILSDLKLDLRRLLFGAVPGLKKITPGGPLVLEPFTITANAQFSKDDILRSTLLDTGLRLLIQRVLTKRVRGIRDLIDGAVFFGRQWNMASKTAPLIKVVELTNIEFDDKRDKFIFTGRVKVRASPGAATIENSFKLRARLGTWNGGKYIGIVEPELALVVECPKAWEKNIHATCRRFKMGTPKRPKPLYSYFPLPLKEKTGYYLGEDNMIKSVYIKDNALRFEISAVVRPGRFLGSHYIAFTVPQRTFIITIERIREGMRVARRNKLAADAVKEAARKASREKVSKSYSKSIAKSVSERDLAEDISDAQEEDLAFFDGEEAKLEDRPDPFADRPGFFGRFVEGYLGANTNPDETDDEVLNERLASAISDYFGRQGKTKKRTGGGFVDRALRQRVDDAYTSYDVDVARVNDDKQP